MNNTVLPHMQQLGILELDGRSIGRGVLSDGRRVLLDLPIEGLLDGAPDHVLRDVAVRYLADDGARVMALDAAALVKWASAYVEGALLAEQGAIDGISRNAPEIERLRQMGQKCSALIAAMSAAPRDAEGAPQ